MELLNDTNPIVRKQANATLETIAEYADANFNEIKNPSKQTGEGNENGEEGANSTNDENNENKTQQKSGCVLLNALYVKSDL